MMLGRGREHAKLMLPIIQAYADGKDIQLQTFDGWRVVDSEYAFDLDPAFYRVKPEPKLRPYNADEMRALVGQIVDHTHGNRSIVETWARDNNTVFIYTSWITAETLLANYTIGGKPCGVEVTQ